MSVCTSCDREMKTATGCDVAKLDDFADGVVRARIKFGDELLVVPGEEPCPDCGVHRGQFHHPGCDQEQCPRCERQLIGACDCR